MRTLLLGHTHYNALEVLQDGEELIPGTSRSAGDAAQKFADPRGPEPAARLLGAPERRRPVRRLRSARAPRSDPIEQSFASFVQQYDRSVAGWQRTLSAPTGPRELVILRLVSAADLSSQTYSSGKSAFGFSVLFIEKKTDARAVAEPQINRAKFFANIGQSKFGTVGTIDIDRMARLRPHDPENPIQKLYVW